jgi:hypothetical protein
VYRAAANGILNAIFGSKPKYDEGTPVVAIASVNPN